MNLQTEAKREREGFKEGVREKEKYIYGSVTHYIASDYEQLHIIYRYIATSSLNIQFMPISYYMSTWAQHHFPSLLLYLRDQARPIIPCILLVIAIHS